MNGMYEIGCRKCGEGGEWSLFTDGHGKFKAKHKCGHISELILADRQDPQAIPMRLIL